MNNSLSSLFLVFSVIIFPLIFWIDFVHYIEFLLLSIFIKIVLNYLNKNSVSNRNLNNILNYAQSLYSCIIIIIVNQATNNGILDTSFLIGDSGLYYSEALRFSKISDSFLSFVDFTNVNYFFYQYLLSVIFKFFESKYLVGLLFSAFIGLINMILLSKIIKSITTNINIRNIALIFYLISPHIISASTTILKDNLIVFSFLLLIYSFYLSFKSKKTYYLYFIISFSLIFLLRLPFIYLYLIVFVFLIIYVRKIKVSALIYIILISMLLAVEGVTNFSTRTFSDDESILVSYNNLMSNKSLAEQQGLYGSGATSFLVSGYNSDPFIIKIIKLPLVVLNQYLTPFNFYKLNHVSYWGFININLKIIWLFFLGPIFLFSILNLRTLTRKYKPFLYVGLAGYVVIAHLQTGLVPRYALCFMVLSYIPMAKVFYETKIDHLFSLKFRYFNLVYFLMGIFGILFYLIFFKI